MSQSAILNDNDNTDIGDLTEKTISQDDNPFYLDLSVIKIASSSDKNFASEIEIQKSLKNCFFNPSFLKGTFKIIEFFLLPDTLLKIVAIGKCQKEILFWRLYRNESVTIHLVRWKTPIKSGSPVYLDYYRFFPNLYNHEKTKLKTVKT